MPKAESVHFEPFIASGSAVFAWGRRLKPDQRHLLIERAIKSASPEYEPHILAWCETCPDEELPSLLDWVGAWEPVVLQIRRGVLLGWCRVQTTAGPL